MIYTTGINTIAIISVFGLILYFILNQKDKNDVEYTKKLQLLDNMIEQTKLNIVNKLEKKEEPSQSTTVLTTQPTVVLPQIIPPRDHVIDRDRAVLHDQLYPPLGRVERPIFDQLASHMASGLFSYPTRGSPDTFRMVGYMVNSDNKHDSWKLFGRQKYPGSSIGEYYAVPVDDRKSDMKITIKDDMMPKDKIRDIYSLPNEVTLKSPLFSDKPYKVVELDKADLTSPYL